MNKIQKIFFSLTLLLGLISYSAVAQNQANKIVFMPCWLPQAQFAGFLMAQEKGFYSEVGLDVEIKYPSPSVPILHYLKDSTADIVSLHLIQAMIAKDQGVDLLNIAQHSQNSSIVIVAEKEITTLDQLSGKRVATWSSGFNELATCLANDNQHTIEWIHIPMGINYFVSGAVAGIVTMYYNEYFSAINCGKKVTEANTFYLKDYGYNIPEDGLYCLRSTYKTKEKYVELFAEATQKGWEYVRENQEETLEIVKKTMLENNIGYSQTLQKWMLNKILELQIDKKTARATYTLDENIFQLANKILLRNGLIKNAVSYPKFVTSQSNKHEIQ